MLRPLLFLALVATYFSTVAAVERYCTRLGRKCIDTARCVNRKCECQGTDHGDGLLHCAKEDEHICLIRADPHITNFANSTASINIPCRYQAAAFQAPLRSGPKTHGCDFTIFGFNLFSQSAKYFAAGVEIQLRIGRFDSLQGSTVLNFDVSNIGIIGENSRPARWGSSGMHTPVGGVTINCDFDVAQKLAIFKVPECGTTIIFRPYEEADEPGPQRLVPGIAIIAPGDARFGPGSLYPKSLCGTPSDSNTLYVERGKALHINDSHAAILHDVLQRGRTIGYELLLKDQTRLLMPTAAECSRTFKAFEKCEAGFQRSEAVRVCYGILGSRRIIRCMGKFMLETFINCIEAFCNINSCSSLVNAFKLALRLDPKCKIPRRIKKNLLKNCKK